MALGVYAATQAILALPNYIENQIYYWTSSSAGRLALIEIYPETFATAKMLAATLEMYSHVLGTITFTFLGREFLLMGMMMNDAWENGDYVSPNGV
jgi:hypothetical protein